MQERYQYVPLESQPLGVFLENQENLQERTEEIVRINHSIRDLSEIYLDINRLVQYQQPFLDNIESNIVNTEHNVIKGTSEIKTAEYHQTKDRKCLCIFATFLIIIFICIILIFSLRSR